MSAKKVSRPMQISTAMLKKAIKKAGGNKTVLSEETGISYVSIQHMFALKKIPSEKHLLKIESFLSKNRYKPRPTVMGRPKG